MLTPHWWGVLKQQPQVFLTVCHLLAQEFLHQIPDGTSHLMAGVTDCPQELMASSPVGLLGSCAGWI
jgi:hypothetical protein